MRFYRKYPIPEASQRTEDQSKLALEAGKLAFDIFKHLITLNTGLILLLITLIKLLYDQDKEFIWKECIAFSLLLAVASIFGCLLMLIIIVMDCKSGWQFAANDKIGEHLIALIGTVLAWGGFILSQISLVVFAIQNIQ